MHHKLGPIGDNLGAFGRPGLPRRPFRSLGARFESHLVLSGFRRWPIGRFGGVPGIVEPYESTHLGAIGAHLVFHPAIMAAKMALHTGSAERTGSSAFGPLSLAAEQRIHTYRYKYKIHMYSATLFPVLFRDAVLMHGNPCSHVACLYPVLTHLAP